jgi:hypothetical protein
MTSVFLFLRTLFLGKVRLLTIFSVITFGGSVILTYYKIYLTLSELLSNIGISFLAGAIVTAYEELKGGKVLQLMNFLSIKNSKKVAIVIPMFDSGHVIPDEKTPEVKIDLSIIPSVSRIDSFSANQFALLIQSHNFDLPQIITDKEALEIIGNEDRSKEYSSFISIGLSSNKFSRAIAKEKLNTNVVKFENPKNIEPGDKIMSIFEGSSFIPQTPNGLNCSDIALFTKISCNSTSDINSHTVFIVGGLNATGTNKIAHFVYYNWFDRISNEQLEKSSRVLNSPNFALFYKVNGALNTRFDKNAKINPRPFHTIKF